MNEIEMKRTLLRSNLLWLQYTFMYLKGEIQEEEEITDMEMVVRTLENILKSKTLETDYSNVPMDFLKQVKLILVKASIAFEKLDKEEILGFLPFKERYIELQEFIPKFLELVNSQCQVKTLTVKKIPVKKVIERFKLFYVIPDGDYEFKVEMV